MFLSLKLSPHTTTRFTKKCGKNKGTTTRAKSPDLVYNIPLWLIVSTVGKDSGCKDRVFALSCYFSPLNAASSACNLAIRSVRSSSLAFCLRATFEPLAKEV